MVEKYFRGLQEVLSSGKFCWDVVWSCIDSNIWAGVSEECWGWKDLDMCKADCVSVCACAYACVWAVKEGCWLVSDDAEVDGGVAVLLNGGQQCGSVTVPDLAWVEVILRVQQLHTKAYINKFKLVLNDHELKRVTKQALPHCQWTWLLQLGISAPPPLWLLQWPRGRFQMDPCECP